MTSEGAEPPDWRKTPALIGSAQLTVIKAPLSVEREITDTNSSLSSLFAQRAPLCLSDDSVLRQEREEKTAPWRRSEEVESASRR